MDDDTLARFLGCSTEELPRLGLCRRPNPGSPDFRAAVEQIARFSGVTPFPLARLLRDVEAVEALRGAQPRVGSEGTFLAARDRPSGESEEPPDGGPSGPADSQEEQ
jgi:hypothetical protein